MNNSYQKLVVMPMENMQNFSNIPSAPFSSAQNISNIQSLLVAPELKFLEKIHQEFNSILNSNDLSPQAKYNKYMENLGKYATIMASVSPTQNIPTTKLGTTRKTIGQVQGETQDTQTTQTAPYDTVSGVLDKAEIRPVHHKNAEKLIEFLSENPNIRWDVNSGQIIYKNSPIPNSHIVDAVHDFVRKRKTIRPGFREILAEIDEAGFPQNFIINKSTVKKHRRTLFDDDDRASPDLYSTPLFTNRKSTRSEKKSRRSAGNRMNYEEYSW